MPRVSVKGVAKHRTPSTWLPRLRGTAISGTWTACSRGSLTFIRDEWHKRGWDEEK